MSKQEMSLCALRKSLGNEYSIRIIDLERVLYRDFGNGFNVEISGVNTTKNDKPATIYLWYGEKQSECMIVRTIQGVVRGDIGSVVDDLCEYTNELIRRGYGDWDSLFRLKHPETIKE